MLSAALGALGSLEALALGASCRFALSGAQNQDLNLATHHRPLRVRHHRNRPAQTPLRCCARGRRAPSNHKVRAGQKQCAHDRANGARRCYRQASLKGRPAGLKVVHGPIPFLREVGKTCDFNLARSLLASRKVGRSNSSNPTLLQLHLVAQWLSVGKVHFGWCHLSYGFSGCNLRRAAKHHARAVSWAVNLVGTVTPLRRLRFTFRRRASLRRQFPPTWGLDKLFQLGKFGAGGQSPGWTKKLAPKPGKLGGCVGPERCQRYVCSSSAQHQHQSGRRMESITRH